MSDLIQAISRGCKGTLADGTVRYTIDIDPNYAAAAAALFGMPGTSLAVAALKDGHQTPQNQPEIAPESSNHAALPVAIEKLKGGELAKWAGILCASTFFWEWINTTDDCLTIFDSGDAASWVRVVCGVESRVELDHDRVAAQVFREQIMAPFNTWKESRA